MNQTQPLYIMIKVYRSAIILKQQEVEKDKSRRTQRAADWWDSARFKDIFLASSFSCSQAESYSKT